MGGYNCKPLKILKSIKVGFMRTCPNIELPIVYLFSLFPFSRIKEILIFLGGRGDMIGEHLEKIWNGKKGQRENGFLWWEDAYNYGKDNFFFDGFIL